MPININKIGVIGAGVMGSQLAALFAGIGADVDLLDIVPFDAADAPEPDPRRTRLAAGAIKRIPGAKPALLYRPADLKRIRPGNLSDHQERLGECDWIIEAVVERREIKRALYAGILRSVKDGAIVTSNTSSILLKSLIDGMPETFLRNFFITHFFNPPRYMKLVEIVGGNSADSGAICSVSEFLEKRLGKGVVHAKDTPGFIANRIGVFHALDVMHMVEESGWPLEAVDTVLGRATGRPKSGIFRMIDMAGIDVLCFAATELVKGLPQDEEMSRCRIPQFLQQMVVKGAIGDKSGQGFYMKDKKTGAIQTFDPSTGALRPRVSFNTPSLAAVSNIADPAERLRRIVFATDQSGEIAWPAISRVIEYAANRVTEIADDVGSVDCAMKWGYNWELGPFETWDALGLKEVSGRLEKEGRPVPEIVENLLRDGRSSFYEWRGNKKFYFDFKGRDFKCVPGSGERISIKRLKELKKTVEENEGASLVDAGDGIFICEFHTKANTIDGGVMSMLQASLARVEREGHGLLIANEGENFSAGANLELILGLAKESRWDKIGAVVKEFQSLGQAIRFAKRPVMALPFGMALGGGCEICLAAAHRAAFIESYMGLVEIAAGLVPAGGGCKNLILMLERRKGAGGPQPKVSAVFELIATARVSRSAYEAADLGLLLKGDPVIFDKERLIFEAKNLLVNLAPKYELPSMRTDVCLPGRGGEMALVNMARNLEKHGKASQYDVFIASKIAHVLAGGDVATVHETDENHVLDLEREAFLSLIGEEKTQRRIEHLLKTGKPLKN